MIFVTVGTQLIFDRLVSSVDEWAGANLEQKVIIQSGASNFKAKFCVLKEYVEAAEWEQLFKDSNFIIAHAGMGTILKCLDTDKPLIIMPRQASLGEHRNDHQLATVSQFKDTPGIYIVNDEPQLFEAIEKIQNGQPGTNIKKTNHNLDNLIGELRNFVNSKDYNLK